MKIKKIDRNYKQELCSKCAVTMCPRHSVKVRKVKEINIDEKMVLEITYSIHYCSRCDIFFNVNLRDIVRSRSAYSQNVKNTVALMLDEGVQVKKIRHEMIVRYNVAIPRSTLQDWITDLMPVS
jgi:RNase P subunit RPR2